MFLVDGMARQSNRIKQKYVKYIIELRCNCNAKKSHLFMKMICKWNALVLVYRILKIFFILPKVKCRSYAVIRMMWLCSIRIFHTFLSRIPVITDCNDFRIIMYMYA